MSCHIFVDESVRRSYLICAVKVRPAALGSTRQALRRLCLPAQRRLHFEREQDRRRRQLLDEIARLEVTAFIYRCDDLNQISARMGCLRQLLIDHADTTSRLVIEACETMDHRDRRLIFAMTREMRMESAFAYEHLRGFEEPILWASDAIAWAVGAGGSWHTRVSGLVAQVVDVKPDFSIR